MPKFGIVLFSAVGLLTISTQCHNSKTESVAEDPTAHYIDQDSLGMDKYLDKGYVLVWSDEFNTPNGSHPDFDNKWVHSRRGTPVWNRFNSKREDLYVIEDGILKMYAKPNTDFEADTMPMLTAAMETTGKFAFTYGIAEARIKNNPHIGSFPAFWMMPEDRTLNGGWPNCGEIDIMEQIDDTNVSYHTLHSYWTNTDGAGLSTHVDTDMAEFHDYAIEWTPEGMVWYVDGNEVSRFSKEQHESTDEYPFDKPFHLIINQAVGAGTWASMYDPEHTYLMEVDYVRVYQKPE